MCFIVFSIPPSYWLASTTDFTSLISLADLFKMKII